MDENKCEVDETAIFNVWDNMITYDVLDLDQIYDLGDIQIASYM